MIHVVAIADRSVPLVKVWRDHAPPVLILAGPVWDEIAKTRDEDARWRLAKLECICMTKHLPEGK